MKIVVLDGYTLNPGDLSWSELEALGECVVYDRTPPGEILGRAAGAEAVLTNKTMLGRREIEGLPDLRYVGVLATGHDVLDLEAARERGIAVTNVPAYGTRSVAQMTFALLLELTHHVGNHSRSVREGKWSGSADFCYWEQPLVELDGLTMGIVGYGNIGRTVAHLAMAFGMEVLCHTKTPPAGEFDGLVFVDVDVLFRESDVVSVHCPLTAETQGLVDARRLSLMKPSAFLLNTSRGPIVDEQALADALNSGTIAGAGLDVLSVEPPAADNPLLAARNCLITPHIAWASQAARRRLMVTVAENLRAFLADRPQNRVA